MGCGDGGFKWEVVCTVPTRNLPLDREVFSRVGARLVTDVLLEPCKEDELLEFAKEADVVISQTAPFTRKVIEGLKKCRFIMIARLGTENVDFGAATERGICVANLGPYCKEEVSDHAMALLLALARRVVETHQKVMEGYWGAPFMDEEMKKVWRRIVRIRGKTLGLVGLGAIGRMVAQKAKGFGMRLIAYDPYVPREVADALGVELVDFDALLRDSDFVSIHCALTPETRGMFGREVFKKMKPTACIINVARGEIVDTEALYEALKEGLIAGAGLDLVGEESRPTPLDHPIYKLPNVIVTGHSAFFSPEAMASMPVIATEETLRVLQGKWPKNLINKEVKERFEARFGSMEE